MTRRDRAALRLAYETLRRPREKELLPVLRIFGSLDDRRLSDVYRHAIEADALDPDGWRLFCARLALLLRCLLREGVPMERHVRVRCVECRREREWSTHDHDAPLVCECGESWLGAVRVWDSPRRYRALWEQAPRHAP